jgi:hypothetical protein
MAQSMKRAWRAAIEDALNELGAENDTGPEAFADHLSSQLSQLPGRHGSGLRRSCSRVFQKVVQHLTEQFGSESFCDDEDSPMTEKKKKEVRRSLLCMFDAINDGDSGSDGSLSEGSHRRRSRSPREKVQEMQSKKPVIIRLTNKSSGDVREMHVDPDLRAARVSDAVCAEFRLPSGVLELYSTMADGSLALAATFSSPVYKGSVTDYLALPDHGRMKKKADNVIDLTYEILCLSPTRALESTVVVSTDGGFAMMQFCPKGASSNDILNELVDACQSAVAAAPPPRTRSVAVPRV